MPRIISTTWFEDLSYVNQPMFDFKLARLSLRQLVYIGVFGMLSYGIVAWFLPLFTRDLLTRGIIGITTFVTGMGIFARRGRVFSPEWYLIYFLKKYLLPSFSSSKKREVSKSELGKATPKPAGPSMMIAPMGKPTRIAGVLRDPSTGKGLPNLSYEVKVDGKPYHTGRTDNDGSYSLIFTPPGPGKFTLTVRPEGYSEDSQKIIVESKTSIGTSEKRTIDRDTLKPSQPSRQAPAPAEEEVEEEEKYVYELFPTNFIDLRPEDQDKLVDRFRGFLNSLDREVKIIVKRSSKEVELGEESTETEYFKFYIQSEKPIDPHLDASDFRYQRTTESPDPRVVDSFRTFTILEDGRNERTATIYQLPAKLIEGFISEYYPVADRITIRIKPLDQGEAVKKTERFFRFQRAIIHQGTGGREEETVTSRAAEALRRLTEEQSRLFKVTSNISVGGSGEEILQEKMERLESTCKGRLVEVDDPMLVQEELLSGELGKELIVDTVTLGAFFPFVSSDVIETPGGVFLGVNRRTGSPIIYDPHVRSSPHVALIGRTGSGKSFSVKAYLTRLFEKHPDMAFFVIDPENEYTKTALHLDPLSKIVNVSREWELGLDPLKLFPRSKDIVLDMLVDALNFSGEESELLAELRVGVEEASSLEELRESVGEKLGKRLDGLLKGPEKFLFEGEPLELSERVVFKLKNLHQALKLSDRRTGTLHTASLLLFGKIWRKIEELPQEKVKVVVVDEVWLYTALPAAASFLEYVSRRGRRRNVVFILSSQRPADVLKSRGGRAAVENCTTKIFLQQDEAAVDLVEETFGLTEREADTCSRFSPGEGILLADDVRVPLKFVVSPDEYARFTTRPGEVIE